MLQRLLLRGLDADQSFAAFSLMLFSPSLREQVCVKECLDYCDELIHLHFFAKPAEFVAEYERMLGRLNKQLPEMPMPSLANPPWAMISLPRLSPQNRPYVISSKPANGIGRRRDCFTLRQRGFARLGLSPRSGVCYRGEALPGSRLAE